jgi:hypothetical protein
MRWMFLCVAFVDSEFAVAASDPTPAILSRRQAQRADAQGLRTRSGP